jgi:hypothetical protein
MLPIIKPYNKEWCYVSLLIIRLDYTAVPTLAVNTALNTLGSLGKKYYSWLGRGRLCYSTCYGTCIGQVPSPGTPCG